MNNHTETAPGTDGLRWLVLDLNSFFASCEQQEQPALRGLPVIVVPVRADTTCAIAASYAAKAYGIKTGTPVHAAKRLCPGLRIVEARPKLYVQYHHRILEAIERHIPIEDVMSIDEMACRLDPSQQAAGRARQLALAIKAGIQSDVGECLTSSIGIAANRLLAKLASNMQKPDGLTILRQQDMPAAILHLPLNAINGIGPNMAARLRYAGIDDMQALWQADGRHLRRAWGGIMGVRFHALLHGADLASPTRPRRSLSHQHVLAPNLRQMNKAAPVIRQLLIRAAQRLRGEGFYCRRLILNIKWAQHQGYWARECKLAETQDTARLLHALTQLWAQAPALPPLRIGVVLADLVMQTVHQPDLFDRPKPAALTGVMDALNAKYGRGTITYGATLADLTSKIAFQRVPGMEEF